MPDTVGAALKEATAALSAAGLEEPRRRARRLLATAMGLSPAEVFGHPEREIGMPEVERIGAMLARLAAHEPLSRILGEREFWGLDFRLCAETLDPRPETETVVEAVLARLPDRSAAWRICDLGTGTGCILLALLSELPQARGVGVDISAAAVMTARGNAARLGLDARAHFAVGDWGAALAGGVDAIVANPPYIASPEIGLLPAEVALHDPIRALDGGPDGLAAFRAIAEQAPVLLRPGGLVGLEIGFGQGPPVCRILRQAGLRVEPPVPDLAGIPRAIVAWA